MYLCEVVYGEGPSSRRVLQRGETDTDYSSFMGKEDDGDGDGDGMIRRI